MMKKISTFLFILLVGMVNCSLAEIRSGSVEVSGYIGPLIGLDKAHFKDSPVSIDPKTGVYSGFRLGYNFTPYIGTEFSWGWSSANCSVIFNGASVKPEIDTSQFLFQSNFVLHLLPKSHIVPFLTTGVGLVYLRGSGIEDFYEKMDESRTRFSPNWGGGIKIFITKDIIFRGDLRFSNFGLGDIFEDRITTLEISVGLAYSF